METIEIFMPRSPAIETNKLLTGFDIVNQRELKILDHIEVFWDQEEKHHQLKLSFRVPIVNDKIDYLNAERKSEGWSIEDGVDFLMVDGQLNKGPGRPKKNVGESV